MTAHKALLLTDVVDSTELSSRHGDLTMAEVWTEHDQLARDLLPQWRGREIDRADGMLLLFDHVIDAVNYALAYQSALRGLKIPLQARVGVHVGPVTLRQASAEHIALGAKPVEVDGIAKAIAARIMSVALGGQTLLSAQAREAIGNSLRVQSHGHWRMKGLMEPVELFEVGDDDAPWLPPPDGAKVYRVVADEELWKPLKDVRHNLPRERDTFVGREAELVALSRLFDTGAALVTLLGTGGCGKTRLARRFGWTWLGEFPGGVWFCDLSLARSPDDVALAVATALDVQLGKGDASTKLGHAIAGRGRCLIILDNFEQVIAHADATVGRWLERARDAVILVTSREPLRLPGEQLIAVDPLPERAAMALFEARARAQGSSFVLDESNRVDVAGIVSTLDGIPLAIELAAARVRVLSPRLLRERLRDRFRLLAGVRATADRHTTLLAAIDWSWDLLTGWERSALAQCSAFVGGFTLEAAESVLDLSAFPDAPLLIDSVQSLVDKSLLRIQAGRHDFEEPYFGMYVTIREYAAEKLRAAGAFDGSGPEGECAAWQRHGTYFASLGAEGALEALHGHGGVEIRRRLVLDLENLVAACRRSVARADGASAVAALAAAWAAIELRGPYESAVAVAREVLGCKSLSAEARARALQCAGSACRLAGRLPDAQVHYEAALVIVRQAGLRRAEGSLLGSMGIVYANQGRIDEARKHFEQALVIGRESGDRYSEGVLLGNLANLHHVQGRFDEARLQNELAIAIYREVGDRRNEGVVLGNLGLVHYYQGRFDLAQEDTEKALEINREVGNRQMEGNMLGQLGLLHWAQGRMEAAQKRYEEALAVHREVGNRRFEGVGLGGLGDVFGSQGRFAEARAHTERAIQILHEVGDRQQEGMMLGQLAKLLVQTGASADAGATFAAGARLLGDVGDKFGLGWLVCGRGLWEAGSGDIPGARASLEEAERLAAEVAASSESDLGRAVITLRERLAANRVDAR